MPQPNLLFIYTDEQRADTMAAYGNARIETPNFNRLADESVVFERAYVSQPVCTPSRSTLLTGQWPHTNGLTENNIPLRPETKCFPERLRPGEYATGHHGKWHLGDEIFSQHGFDDFRSIEDNYTKYYSEGHDKDARSTYHHFLIENGHTPKNGLTFGRGEAARLPEEVGKPAYLAREASRFIRENRDRPWCLFVNFLEPHMPFFGPRDNQYDPDAVPLPPNFEGLPGPDQPLKTRLFQRAYYEHGHGGFDLKTERDWREMIARYWGLCSLVDTHLGTILDTLEACGLDENTIIVYTSDHGDMMGSHRLLAKCVMFEEAARVPLLVRLAGGKGAKRVTEPVSHIDLVPTLLDLMGQPIDPCLQGRSLAGVVQGDDRPGDDVIMEWNGLNNGFGDRLGGISVPECMRDMATADECRAAIGDPVRTLVSLDGWKFNCSPLGEHELYNLNDDPYESRNLAKDPASRAIMSELTGRIRAWQERTGDTVALPNIA